MDEYPREIAIGQSIDPRNDIVNSTALKFVPLVC
jgi:hypothetical protein